MKTLWQFIKTTLFIIVIILAIVSIITINIGLLWMSFLQFNVGLNPTFNIQALLWLIPIATAIAFINIIFYELMRLIYWDN